MFDESRAAFVVLTVFTGVAVLLPRGPKGAAKLGYRVWSWRKGRGWNGNGDFYIDQS